MNIGILVVLGVFGLAGLGLLIWITLRSQMKARSEFSIYLRLVLGHTQLLMLLASFRFEWPPEVRRFFALFQSVADAPQQLFSVDCLFQQVSTLPRFFNMLVAYWMLPLGGAALLAVFWLIQIRPRHRPARLHFKARFIASWLVFLFLIHPGVASVLFGSFSCYDLEGDLWLREELSERCWEGRHLRFTLSLGLSGMLLWVIGLPLWTGLVLR